jgi:hypothetical protein
VRIDLASPVDRAGAGACAESKAAEHNVLSIQQWQRGQESVLVINSLCDRSARLARRCEKRPNVRQAVKRPLDGGNVTRAATKVNNNQNMLRGTRSDSDRDPADTAQTKRVFAVHSVQPMCGGVEWCVRDPLLVAGQMEETRARDNIGEQGSTGARNRADLLEGCGPTGYAGHRRRG